MHRLPQARSRHLSHKPTIYGSNLFVHSSLQDLEPKGSLGEHAVPVLAPRAATVGQEGALVIPAVVTAPGPVLVTSTKPEVMRLCADAIRARGGRCWLFEPTGSSCVTHVRSAASDVESGITVCMKLILAPA